MSSPRVITVILAAGVSRRLGRPKQLLQRDGETLVSRIAVAAIASRSAEVAVVTGAYRADVEAEVVGAGVQCLYNPCFQEGMASSIRIGACWAVRQRCDGVLFVTCDQPFVSGAHIDKLVDAFEEHGGRVASYCSGIAISPAVFPREDLGALMRLRGDEGARSLLRDDGVWLVPFPGGAIDLDTEADAQHLLDGRSSPRESGVHPVVTGPLASLVAELGGELDALDAVGDVARHVRTGRS